VSAVGDLLLGAVAGAQHHVRLVSPYLSLPIAQRLAEYAEASTAPWSLITRFDAAAVAGGFLSTAGLRLLVEAGVAVRSLARLHAKVYLVDDEFGVVGSANLTGSGLGTSAAPNRELSVRIEPNALVEVEDQVDAWWGSAASISLSDIAALEAAARALPREAPIVLPEPSEATASVALADLLADARGVNLWVKAQYGEPDADQWRQPFWFSSRRDRIPSFKPRDLVLIYAKEAHACYAIIEVTSEPFHSPAYLLQHGRPESEAERWPWVNETLPRLVPTEGREVRPQDLGFTGQSLQGGHKRLGLTEFAAAARALAGDEEAL